MHPYSRELNSIDKISHFLSVVIKHDNPNDDSLLEKIRSGETEMTNFSTFPSTISSTENRKREYKEHAKRWELRREIVHELFTFIREADDDHIVLGKGGAIPNCDIHNNKEAFLIIGLPASGKSSIANEIADKFGAVILDSDYAKRKLPEFGTSSAGASLVHDESDFLIFGKDISDKPDDFQSLFEICLFKGHNIVIPKIGHNVKSINDLAKSLSSVGYQTHLILVSLDRRKATKRAIERFEETNRYVPLSLIFDGYGNDPILTFYRLKDKINMKENYITSFGKLSTEVNKGENPIVIFADNNSPANIFKQK